MPRPYADYDDLLRDLDQEGLSDDTFAGLDDDDLALLEAIDPDRPATKKPAAKRKPTKRRPKAAAKKPRAE